MHQLSLLDRCRYVKQLIWRIPPQATVLSLIYQIWDMEASEDILIRCALAWRPSHLVGWKQMLHDAAFDVLMRCQVGPTCRADVS